MAVDEALLLTARDRDRVTLRVYRWEQPTLSLGYFQHYRERQQHAASQDCPVVRRATGGGAIIHDQEITYSLTAPVADRVDRRILDWYGLAHRAWIEAFAEYGACMHLCSTGQDDLASEFLCFQRRSPGDLLLGDWKVGGSAQRRHRNAVLQHGSLLIGQSPAAPELPGIAQFTGLDLTQSAWLDNWILKVGQKLGVVWTVEDLAPHELDLATQLSTERFGAEEWTLQR